jgi:hypothetical protein
VTGTLFAVIMRETNHILTAYTQKSGGDKPPNREQLDSLLQRALAPRLIPQRLIPRDRKDPNGNLVAKSDAEVKDKRSPADKPFEIAARHLEAVVVPPSEAALLSRPLSFSFADGKAAITPDVGDAVESVKVKVQSTGVRVAVTLSKDKSLKQETPVVCVMRTAENHHAISQAVLPKDAGKDQEASAIVPFGAIDAGRHHFLILLKGFVPIWDHLEVGEERVWLPAPSP